jgi:hypothetical protein
MFNQTFDGASGDPRDLRPGLFGNSFKLGVLQVGQGDRHAVCVLSIFAHGSDSIRGYPRLFIPGTLPGRLPTGKKSLTPN